MRKHLLFIVCAFIFLLEVPAAMRPTPEYLKKAVVYIWSEGAMEWVTDGEKDGVIAFVRTLGKRRVRVSARLKPPYDYTIREEN